MKIAKLFLVSLTVLISVGCSTTGHRPPVVQAGTDSPVVDQGIVRVTSGAPQAAVPQSGQESSRVGQSQTQAAPQAVAIPVTSPDYVRAVQQGPGPGAPIFNGNYGYRPYRVATPPQIWPAAGGYAPSSGYYGAGGYGGYGGYGGGYYYPTVPSRSTGSVKWDVKNTGFFETGHYRHLGYTAYPRVQRYYDRGSSVSVGVGVGGTVQSGLRHW
ncbi:MAG: hypothetical protein G01um101472_548 [Parcubacteria group bacterium Gr01-1014_72]|nr:MAG: hypothetical protein G01um101472_548 [Parcubacteria group bacterium Gr01-1014_72]